MAKINDPGELLGHIADATCKVRGDNNRGHDALLFLNTQYESFPVMLQQDSLISANAKNVFNNLWIWAKTQQAGSIPASLFPSYEYIKRATGLEKGTIASAMTQLRLQRYLTLHSKVHNDKGHFIGNDYILNDEPMEIGDTLIIDKQYVDFVHGHVNHRHQRVQRLAELIANSIEHHIEATVNPFSPATQMQKIETRQQAAQIIQNRLFPEQNPLEGSKPTHYFGIPYEDYEREMNRVHKMNSGDFEQEDTQVHKMNSGNSNKEAQVHKVNSGFYEEDSSVHKVNSGDITDNEALVHFMNPEVNHCSSSSLSNITTPTAVTPEFTEPSVNTTEEGADQPELIYPDFQTPNELAICKLHIQKIDAEHRQPILDELAARMQSTKQESLENPIGYLKGWLLKSLEKGDIPYTSLGAQYAANRSNPKPTKQQLQSQKLAIQTLQSEIEHLNRLIGFHEAQGKPENAQELIQERNAKQAELEQLVEQRAG